jgi:PAS domain S-box-containing protein
LILLNGFDNIIEIHRDSRSITYSGIQSANGRPSIIKYFPFEKLTSSHIVQLTYEYEQAKYIESEHVSKVYGFEKVREQNWNGLMFFMENPPGISLRLYLISKKIHVRELLDIAIQIAQGLKELHRYEIIHSDINPNAIIVNPETRNIKIRDFGFNSITAYKTEEIYNPEILRNNLPYISPEQTGRTSRKIDYRSDFYSLGMTLYEALTGEPPFPSQDPLEIIHAHMTRQPQPSPEAKDAIPQMVYSIIMKLIAKNPESRYQSAHGIISDLQECMNQLKSSGRIEVFTPGKNDIHDRFIIPQKLYGRKNEIDNLTTLFEQTRQGPSRFSLVSGPGGIGKSTLIHELHRPVTRHKGYFALGKFNSLNSDMPYSALIQAFQGLIKQILTESDERLQIWKSALLEAVGSNGRIITDIVPEAELLIGRQAEVPETGPEESQNRFKFFLKKFVSIFGNENHPLVLALEDLQWADSSSLALLQNLAAESGLSYILFIGSYRNDSDQREFSAWLENLKQLKSEISDLKLEPLSLSDVTELIIDTLKSPADACRSLAELIYRKTGGNPFFVKQFLKRLNEDDILVYTTAVGWHWDLNRIQMMQATDNVIELMIERISRMQATSIEILKIAAIIGNRFNPEILAEVCDKPVNDIIIDLNESIQNELIILVPPYYTFSHDRIHESILSIISDSELNELHNRIGNAMLGCAPAENMPEIVFNTLDHFNRSLDQVTDPAQKKAIIQMNILAANKAKLSNAYASAVKYLDYAISLLPPDMWEKDYETAFSIFLEKASAQYLAGIIPEDESLFNTLLIRAQTSTDKAKIYSLLIVLRSHQNRIDEAIGLGIKVCKLFNLKFSPNPGMSSIFTEFLRVRKSLKKVTIHELYNKPEIKDRGILQLMDLLVKIAVPAYHSNLESHRKLLFLITLKLLALTLKHGNSKYSAFAYVAYGAIIGAVRGEYQKGYELGRLGITLDNKYSDLELRARIYHLFGSMIGFWNQPFNEYIEYFTTAFQTGIAMGDFLFTSFSILNIFFHSFRKGKDINSLILIYETHLNFIKLSRFSLGLDIFNIFYAMIYNLKGIGGAQGIIPDVDDDPALMIRIGKNRYVLHLYYLTRIISSYMFGDYDKALEMASLMEKEADRFLYAVVHIEEYYLYYGLAIAGNFDSLTPGSRKRYAKILEKSVHKLKLWSDTCQENFLHLYLLLKAELLRIHGRDLEALNCYGQAIQHSQKNGYINHEAIICERAADFHIRLGNPISAGAHVNQALNCFRQWGADMKVRDIERKFSLYLQQTPTGEVTSTRLLNYASIVNSLQAISSEIITEDLLKKLMKIALENAGADRGFFITVEANSATIVAETTMTDDIRTIVKSIPYDVKKDLLIPVINYVMRSKKCLVIHDARREENIPLDQYPEDSRPMSVLCLPIERHAKLTGILYLENRIVAGAFTADHIEILQLLSSQAAISLEIAQLYDKLTQEITQHWKAETALRNSEDRYRLVVESMNEGISVLDEVGRLKFVNTRFCEMIGYERNEILGVPLERYLAETSVAILKQQLLRRRRGEHEPYEIGLMKKDGRIISTIVSPRPIYDTEGNFAGSFGLFTDITEKKKMEEDLLKASKIETLGVFAGGIAHDFNNLLTAIIGNISLARLNIPQDDQTFAILAEAENASLRAKDLTHQLLTFSKGGAPIKKTTSIKKLLRQTIDFALSGSNIVCIYTIQNDLWNAEIDEGQISQVIHNLVINAMQAMQEGGAIEVKAKNVIVDEQSLVPLKPGHYIWIEITDQGTGIPPENQKYIFDPYFTTKENGSGLGLTVSYSIIKRHEGIITFESEFGRGTAFIMYLPSSKSRIMDQLVDEQKNVLASGRCLVMDDDEVVLRVAGNMLTHLGISADFATHGQEAIDLYMKSMETDHPYDIIIMDLTVPGKMGGKETIARLKEINPAIKAIVSSGYSNDPVMANYTKYGFKDVVAKPYRIEDLRAVINRVMISE